MDGERGILGARLMPQTAGKKLPSRFAAGAKKVRALSSLLRHTANQLAVSVLPDSLLGRGTYRAYVVKAQSWEDEYRSGQWAYMNDLPELGRYSVIVGYYNFFKPAGSVLDVGCGEGILQQRLLPLGYRRYLGLDLSETAIARALDRVDERTEFQRADVERFAPEETFDVIVFNEVLHYFYDPLATIRRFARSLEPDGIMVASICYSPPDRRKALQIWRMIDSDVVEMDSTTVANREAAFTLKVFQPTVLSCLTGNGY